MSPVRIGALRPLRHRDFALMWAGLAVSMLGDGVYFVAVAWQAYELSSTPAALSIVGVAWTLPTVVLLLAGGVVSDRLERRRLMLVADALRAAAVGTIAVLSLIGALELWQLVLLVAVYGTGEALFLPAATAIVPTLVPAEELVLASALEQTARPLALRFAGPALGGALVALGGAGLGFAFDAASFAFSALCLAAMRPGPLPAGVERQPGAAVRELREGFAYVRSQPWLWATLLSASLALLAFYGPLEVLLPYRIKNELHLSAGTFGLVLASAGVAQVAAALALGQRGLPRRNITAMYVGWACASAAVAGYALVDRSWQMMLIGAVAGACNGVGAIVWSTLMQTLVPQRLLGRVSSVDWLVSMALIPVSFALAGPLAAAFGAQSVLIASGTIGALVGLSFLLIPRVREPELAPLRRQAASS
jgi:MFS family permease